ncbi:MAG: GNAT family N-acetyltransferase [Oscillospiraceae bacterium]|nr:GNAT family N-acetyltransferase [Oscillospiraceae bacterium]
MEFRKAVKNDIPQLNSVFAGIIEDLDSRSIHVWDEVYPCCDFPEDIENGGLYVLYDGDKLVSAFAIYAENISAPYVDWLDNDAKALYVERLGVAVEYGRQGIAEFMMERAADLVKESGFEYLRLFVAKINAPAIAFYEKAGFSFADGVYIDEIGGTPLPELGMEKKIL